MVSILPGQSGFTTRVSAANLPYPPRPGRPCSTPQSAGAKGHPSTVRRRREMRIPARYSRGAASGTRPAAYRALVRAYATLEIAVKLACRTVSTPQEGVFGCRNSLGSGFESRPRIERLRLGSCVERRVQPASLDQPWPRYRGRAGHANDEERLAPGNKLHRRCLAYWHDDRRGVGAYMTSRLPRARPATRCLARPRA